jgi:hypothetical protein
MQVTWCIPNYAYSVQGRKVTFRNTHSIESAESQIHNFRKSVTQKAFEIVIPQKELCLLTTFSK